MGNISQELEKLLSYTMGRDDHAGGYRGSLHNADYEPIFEMIRAVTEKKQRKALDLYQDLLALKEPPMRILFLLARQFNLLLQVKELLAEHCDQATIAKRTGLQSFVVRNYIPMSRQYAAEELKRRSMTACRWKRT